MSAMQNMSKHSISQLARAQKYASACIHVWLQPQCLLTDCQDELSAKMSQVYETENQQIIAIDSHQLCMCGGVCACEWTCVYAYIKIVVCFV